MSEYLITDDEILYRRVSAGRDYEELSDGTIKISSQAFYTSSRRPSVDRAKLRKNSYETLGGREGGVASLVTKDVRSIDIPAKNGEKEHIDEFKVDIEYAPIFGEPDQEDNIAHAEIYVAPICTRKAFRVLVERLALLANARPWEIKPPI